MLQILHGLAFIPHLWGLTRIYKLLITHNAATKMVIRRKQRNMSKTVHHRPFVTTSWNIEIIFKTSFTITLSSKFVAILCIPPKLHHYTNLQVRKLAKKLVNAIYVIISLHKNDIKETTALQSKPRIDSFHLVNSSSSIPNVCNVCKLIVGDGDSVVMSLIEKCRWTVLHVNVNCRWITCLQPAHNNTILHSYCHLPHSNQTFC